MDKQIEIIKYATQGTCSKFINIAIKDNIIVDLEYVGGCGGNTRGIASLVIGMSVDEVIKRLQGITCGSKPTSCPDQLSKALTAYIAERETIKAN